MKPVLPASAAAVALTGLITLISIDKQGILATYAACLFCAAIGLVSSYLLYARSGRYETCDVSFVIVWLPVCGVIFAGIGFVLLVAAYSPAAAVVLGFFGLFVPIIHQDADDRWTEQQRRRSK